jgi:phage repressor protein C with HTH and peptisase S24 domain
MAKSESEIKGLKARLEKLIGEEKPFSWASRVGIPGATFTRLWKEGVAPKSETLLKIHETTGASIDWLLTGEGPMCRGQVEQPAVPYSEEQIGWDAELMTEIIQKYEKALTEQKAYVSPVEKGKMYAKLYEIYRTEKVAIDDNEVRRTLRLVVNQS